MLFFATLMEDYKKIVPAIVNQHSYPGSVYVKHAMDYIAHHYREKIKISELADYIGVNRSYLTSSFKKAIGCSPQEYLVNLRMEKAKRDAAEYRYADQCCRCSSGVSGPAGIFQDFQAAFRNEPQSLPGDGRKKLQLVSEKRESILQKKNLRMYL